MASNQQTNEGDSRPLTWGDLLNLTLSESPKTPTFPNPAPDSVPRGKRSRDSSPSAPMTNNNSSP